MVAEIFLTAQYIKEVWVFISLTPNLYAISLHAAAMSKKTVPAAARPSPRSRCADASPAHRMRILLVSEMIPCLPSHDGFRLIPANLIRNLFERHEIHLIALSHGEEARSNQSGRARTANQSRYFAAESRRARQDCAR